MRFASFTTALLLGSALTAATAHACSWGGFPISLREGEAFFTASAVMDTLLAGPGTVRYGEGAGHFGSGAPRPIYGQLFDVDRMGGPASAALPAGVREVVVVPWDYDSACRPLPWSRSARWIEPGKMGFYIATLRAPEQWVDGKPTFDLHNPGDMPYTGTDRTRETGLDTVVASLLTPDQLFGFFREIPSSAEIASRGEQALERLRNWARAHPAEAARAPAPSLAAWVVGEVERAELKTVEHPVMGTWRFTLRVALDTAYTFYARSEAYPQNRWSPSPARQQSGPADLRLRPAVGYTFVAAVSRRLETLPDVSGSRTSYTYFHALASPDTAGAGETVWHGWFEGSLLQQAFPGDARMKAAAVQAFERYFARRNQGLPESTPARFTRGPDGVLRVRQSFPLNGAADLVLEGEQLSRDVIRTPI